MSIVDTVKTARRISHSKLDEEITRLSNTAAAEMIRAGVDPEKAADESDDLIVQAKVVYCLMEMSGSDRLRDQYRAAWELQLDSIRKSEGYRCTTASSSSEE